MGIGEFKRLLAEKHVFWNVDPSKIDSLPNAALIEYTLSNADWPEWKILFSLFPFVEIKSIWLARLAADSFQYKNNYILVSHFFDIANPGEFLKTFIANNSRLEKLKHLASEHTESN